MEIEERLHRIADQEFSRFPKMALEPFEVLSVAKRKREESHGRAKWLVLTLASGTAAMMALAIVLPITLGNTKSGSNNPSSSLTDGQTFKEKMLKAGEEFFKGKILPQGLSIVDDYGEISGAYVARFGGVLSDDQIHTETIGSLMIVSPDDNTIKVFDGTKIYSLKDAYRELLLDANELTRIKAQQVAWHSDLIETEKGLSSYAPYDYSGELFGDRIILEDKVYWDGNFEANSSKKALDVTIDWNFNAHHFLINDFHYDAIVNVECLTSSYFDTYASGYPFGVNQEYRLTLASEGEDQIKAAVAALKDRDYLKSVKPEITQ